MVVNPVDYPDTSAASAYIGNDLVSGVIVAVTSTEDVAKRIESHLRNAGHPLRVTWINTLEALEDNLRRTPPDILLCDREVRGAPRDRVIALCGNVQSDLPVLLIARKWSVEASVAALSAGAQDFVAYEDAEHLRHLELVVLREFVKHQHLRQLRQTRERLMNFESRHQQLTESTADAVATIQEGIVSTANSAFAKLLGYDSPARLAGQPLIDLVDATHQAHIKERLRAVGKGKLSGEVKEELLLVGKSGPVKVSAQMLIGTHEGESVIEMVIPKNSVEQPVSAPVRGRSAFAAALAQPPVDATIARGAMLVHIDDFLGLETRIGHTDAQDINSQAVAAIQSLLKPDDQDFMFSADEIALLTSRGTLDEIEGFANAVRNDIKSQVFTAPGHEAQVTLSIAVFPLGPGDRSDLVVKQLATEARKLSTKGGNAVLMLGATAQASVSERDEARRATLVKRALEENRFKLAYQSIASLEGEARSHYDILLRMLDESGREFHAAEFLPPAQKFNLMRSIDRWVVKSVLDIIARRTPGTDESTLFVKLAEDTIRDADVFIGWLKGATQTRPMRNEEIVFEVQELVLQGHITKGRALLQTLSQMGAGIAIEHFGIGTNSAELLDHIPSVGYLKFHSSFTHNFGDPDTQKRLMDLVETAKQRKIKTIVSHVEDANVMARLWQMGVNFIQGYHIKEPEVVLMSGDSLARR